MTKTSLSWGGRQKNEGIFLVLLGSELMTKEKCHKCMGERGQE